MIPVDAKTVPLVYQGDNVEVNGGAELSRHLATSKKLDACFARKAFRFNYRRTENLETDSCSIQSLYDTLQEKGLKAMFKQMVMDSKFKQRKK